MTALPRLDQAAARRLFLHRHALSGDKTKDLGSLIHRLGFVQIDSINTVARAHHMILHARKTSYRQTMIDTALKRREIFEHWTHDASYISMAFFPHWRHKMARQEEEIRTKWKSWRRDGYEGKFDAVLRQIADHGPCCSSDVGQGEQKGSGGWWDWHPSKTALEYLWRKGDLSVCHRKGFRKYYDLTERVIPPEYLNARPKLEETIDWACMAALQRLGFATPTELARFWDLVTIAEAKTWTNEAARKGRIISADVQMADQSWRRVWTTPEALQPAPPPSSAIRVLSPFDPALRDRARAQRLFGFDYKIEIFVPEAKRKYGYYVFPLLQDARLIGRIDMKSDRKSGHLVVKAFWPEKGVAMTKTRQRQLMTALERSARMAGSSDITFETGFLKTPV